MGWRDVGFFVRGRLSRTIARALNRKAPPPAPAAPLDEVLRGPVTPLALTRLLEGRTNAAREPRGRVRLLFSACEEIGYLGSRAWVREHGVADVRGVLSLELPGVGDSLAVWDAGERTWFLDAVRGTLEDLGLRADEGHHVVGRIPVFGSDHRAFAVAGVPAYGFTSVPAVEADALRQFVFHPVRAAVRASMRRPPPFDTYHTARDTGATLDAAALDRMAAALAALVESV